MDRQAGRGSSDVRCAVLCAVLRARVFGVHSILMSCLLVGCLVQSSAALLVLTA